MDIARHQQCASASASACACACACASASASACACACACACAHVSAAFAQISGPNSVHCHLPFASHNWQTARMLQPKVVPDHHSNVLVMRTFCACPDSYLPMFACLPSACTCCDLHSHPFSASYARICTHDTHAQHNRISNLEKVRPKLACH